MKPNTHSQLNDLRIRLIGIPFFGVGIPLIANLFGPIGPGDWRFWVGFLYFIALAWTIWMGNRYFLILQRRHYDWFSQPVQKLMILVSANVFYTAPLTAAWLAGWYAWAGFTAIDWETVKVVTLINVIAVIFVTHVYETVFLIRQREMDMLNLERLNRAKAEAELEALKNQIDPHFMFNSLNTLAFLIENQPQKALEFNEHLSDVYRYILMNKNKELVLLKDEIEFMNHYFSLLKLRFGDSIRLHIRKPEGSLSSAHNHSSLIPPISLQLLLENAVKHNEFDEGQPMEISLLISEDSVSLSNGLRPFSNASGKSPNPAQSTRTGLQNLNERYQLITQQAITIESNSTHFTVTLPTLNSRP